MESPSAPLIGVIADHKVIQTTDRSDSARTFVGAFATYLRCLTAAGALPVVVPLEMPPASLRGIFDRLDGVLLTGGGDIDPALYGEASLANLALAIKPYRDQTEILISQWAAEANKPFLAICRGHQVVNVALGGTLYVDIPTQISTSIEHDTPNQLPLDYHAHHVAIKAGSRLASVLGTTDTPTNSRHHQAIREPGRDLAVVAHAPDGVIEACEIPGARFFLTVQWHPENMCHNSSGVMPALFSGLVEAGTRYHRDMQAK